MYVEYCFRNTLLLCVSTYVCTYLCPCLPDVHDVSSVQLDQQQRSHAERIQKKNIQITGLQKVSTQHYKHTCMYAPSAEAVKYVFVKCVLLNLTGFLSFSLNPSHFSLPYYLSSLLADLSLCSSFSLLTCMYRSCKSLVTNWRPLLCG